MIVLLIQVPTVLVIGPGPEKLNIYQLTYPNANIGPIRKLVEGRERARVSERRERERESYMFE